MEFYEMCIKAGKNRHITLDCHYKYMIDVQWNFIQTIPNVRWAHHIEFWCTFLSHWLALPIIYLNVFSFMFKIRWLFCFETVFSNILLFVPRVVSFYLHFIYNWTLTASISLCPFCLVVLYIYSLHFNPLNWRAVYHFWILFRLDNWLLD